MESYYAERLTAERLRECYEIAPPRVQQYLEAEVRYIKNRLQPSDDVLELGCGYGRVLRRLALKARVAVGIDTSAASLRLGRKVLSGVSNCWLLRMNAVPLGFRDRVFDLVTCVQNGISALRVDRRALIAEAVRVTRPGGRVLFSSYAGGFWEDRLDWFRLQSERGLLGKIDWQATRDGTIVCTDGFRATTVSPDEFRWLTRDLDVDRRIEEVDGSSVFCELRVRERPAAR
jgi:2-polyprenyl-6-hydroxyphenyl methylase/3-demethylubiquinone-9 3-methyltransferase